jgi:antitoxin MazE
MTLPILPRDPLHRSGLRDHGGLRDIQIYMRVKTQLAKWGTSKGGRIPKPILEAAQLHEGDSVALDVDHGSILRPTLEELVNGISDQNMHGETYWGGPRRKEAW